MLKMHWNYSEKTDTVNTCNFYSGNLCSAVDWGLGFGSSRNHWFKSYPWYLDFVTSYYSASLLPKQPKIQMIWLSNVIIQTTLYTFHVKNLIILLKFITMWQNVAYFAVEGFLSASLWNVIFEWDAWKNNTLNDYNYRAGKSLEIILANNLVIGVF